MLESFFHPKSVAIIGASNKPGKVGNDVMINLAKNYKGVIYPINPNDEIVEGLNTFATISDAPEVPELAVIVIPSKFVPEVLEECGKAGCKNIVVISAGFKEAPGTEGAELEKKLIEIKDKYNLRVLGPNCLGYITTSPAVNASFARSFPKKGGVAFMSQSGALGTAVLDMAQAQQLGLSYFASIGNKMDIDEIDLLEYFSADKKTKAIIAYLENIVDGPKFISTAKRITKKKPVILLKSGKTEKGSQAVSSHTGSLAGSTQAYSAAFKQSGVIEVDDVEDFFDFAKGFSLQQLPQGNRVAIITNAGGPGILVTDLLPKYGLELANLKPDTTECLKGNCPSCANTHNPIDILGDADADRYAIALDAAVHDDNVDCIIVVLTPQKSTQIKETAELIGKVNKKTKKTIIACFMGEKEVVKNYPIFRKYSLPQYNYPMQAVKVLGQMWNYANWKKEKLNEAKENQFENKTEAIAKAKKILSQSSVTESEAREILEGFDFPLHKAKTVKDAKEAVEFAESSNCYPLALKVVSPQIIHKSDVGGVKLNIKNAVELEKAIEDMIKKISVNQPEAVIEGFLVGEMISGMEVIVGLKRDPQFGSLIMAGMGGTYTEIFKDITFRVAPITKEDAQKMLQELKIYPLLKGARGAKLSDINALVDLLVKVADFSLLLPQIKEIDFNPIMVREEGKGCVIVDTRFML
ncbi:MAG: acetate--CoA ligase family protein [Patescibacteria group bacterium]|jgi:acetyltransferase